MLINYNKLRIYGLSLCIMGKYIYFCICVFHSIKFKIKVSVYLFVKSGRLFLFLISQKSAVEPTSLTIKHPPPLIEIPDHIDDMNAEHTTTLVRCCSVVVNDADTRIIHRAIASMHASGDVDILGIHEETLVE